jgi:hypothetical protein
MPTHFIRTTTTSTVSTPRSKATRTTITIEAPPPSPVSGSRRASIDSAPGSLAYQDAYNFVDDMRAPPPRLPSTMRTPLRREPDLRDAIASIPRAGRNVGRGYTADAVHWATAGSKKRDDYRDDVDDALGRVDEAVRATQDELEERDIYRYREGQALGDAPGLTARLRRLEAAETQLSAIRRNIAVDSWTKPDAILVVRDKHLEPVAIEEVSDAPNHLFIDHIAGNLPVESGALGSSFGGTAALHFTSSLSNSVGHGGRWRAHPLTRADEWFAERGAVRVPDNTTVREFEPRTPLTIRLRR